MSNKGQLLQDPFLNTLRKEHVPVSIYLVNGIKLQGQIESFDQYVVLLRNTVTQMVYKHAISTVVPSRPINLGADKDAEQLAAHSRSRRSRPAADPQAAILVCLDFGDDDYAESVDELVRLVRERRRASPPRDRAARAQRPDPRSSPAAARSTRSRAPPTSERRRRHLRPRALARAAAQPRAAQLERRACSTAPS